MSAKAPHGDRGGDGRSVSTEWANMYKTWSASQTAYA